MADKGAPPSEWDKPLSLLPSPYAGRRRGHVRGAYTHSLACIWSSLQGYGQVATKAL